MEQIISDHIHIWTAAKNEKKSGRGRSNSNAVKIYGIEKLRGLILSFAVMGRLVPQDPNDEAASELLKKIDVEKGINSKTKNTIAFNKTDIPYDVPPGWQWVSFGDIAQHNSGKTLDSSRNTGTPQNYITTSNLYWGRFDLSSLGKMPIEDHELEKCTAKKGDLLIVEGGEAGRAAVWESDNGICFQNHTLSYIETLLFYIL